MFSYSIIRKIIIDFIFIMDADQERERLIQLQMQMQSHINNTLHVDKYRYVGGADLTEQDDMFVGCFVVVDCEDNLKVIYQKCTEMRVDVPYYSGLLGFREGPVVLALYDEFCHSCPEIKLDVIITDGSGEWHPRGFGLACYVGCILQIPTIGVFKNFLFIDSGHDRKEVIQEANNTCKEIGDVIILNHELNNGRKVKCAAMKTTNSTPFRPIYISPGNLIDLDSSIEIVKKLCHFREPEPVRLADRISREYIRNKKIHSFL